MSAARLTLSAGLALTAMLVSGAGCPKRTGVEASDCHHACRNLARLLAADRQQRGLPPIEDLDPDTAAGRRHVGDCVSDCTTQGSREQVACLKRADSLKQWIICGRDAANE